MVKIIYQRNKSLKKDLMQDKTASFYMVLHPLSLCCRDELKILLTPSGKKKTISKKLYSIMVRCPEEITVIKCWISED